jgi:hypothetical protein
MVTVALAMPIGTGVELVNVSVRLYALLTGLLTVGIVTTTGAPHVITVDATFAGSGA